MSRPQGRSRGPWIAGGILLVLVLVLFIGPRLIPTGFVRREITRLVRQETGLTLKIKGPVRLSVFPTLGLTLSRTTLENPPGFQGPPLLSVGQAAVGVSLIPLISGHIEVTELSLSHIALTLLTNRRGISNYAPLARLAGAAKPAPAKSKAPPRRTSLPFAALGRIHLQHVTISVINRKTGAVDHLHLREVKAGPIEPARRFPFLLKAQISTHHPQSISATLELKTQVLYQPTEGLNLRGTSFRLTVTKPRHLVLRGEAKSLGLNLSKELISIHKINIQGNGFTGFLAAEGRLAPSALRSLSGRVNLRLDRIEPWFGAGLDHLLRNGTGRPPLTFVAAWHITARELSLTQMAVGLGPEHWRGFFRMGTVGKPRAFSFLLDGNSLTLNTPPPTSGGVSRKKSSQASVRAVAKTAASPAHTQSLSWLKAYAGSGRIRLGALHADGIRARNIVVNLKMARGVLTASPLSAQLLGGRLAGAGSLSAGSKGAPHLTFNLNLHQLSARKLVSSLGSRNLSPLAGRLDASLVARFTGENKAALAHTLAGNGVLAMHKARWQGLNLDRVVSAVRQALTGHIPASWPQGGVTPLGRMNLSFRLAGPILNIESLALETPGLAVTGRGQLNWVAPRLALQLLLAPRPNAAGRGEWPPALHGIKIPISVTGSPQSPRVRPNLSAILKAEARAKAKSLLGGFLGHLIPHG